jgi:hypothetical protein
MTSPDHVRAALRVAVLLASAQKSVNEVTREYDDTLTRFCFDVLLGGGAVDFRRSHKSVNEVTREYDDTLTRFAFDVLNGNLGAVDFRRSHKALLRSLAGEAYAEGLREGGVDADEQDDDDRATVSGWVDEQVSHVNDFAAWLAGGDPRNSSEKRRQLGERVGLWVQALDNLGGLGRASAKANTMVTWKRGPTSDGCDTCVELDGSRHRLKWYTSKGYIPREVGSSTLECSGYRCLCGLYDDKGARIL